MDLDHGTMAQRIGQLREWSGKSARRLSKLAGLTATHLALIEEGERAYPRASTLHALAELFGTTIEWILMGTGDAPTQGSVRAAVERALADDSGPAVSTPPIARAAGER